MDGGVMNREKWMSTEGYESGLQAEIKLGQDSLRDKNGLLFVIEVVLYSCAKGYPAPRSAAALFVGVGAGFAVAWGVAYMSMLDGVGTSLLVGGLLGLICGVVVYRYSSLHRSHIDHLDDLLSQYEPLVKQAYIDLQEEIGRDGFELQSIDKWLQQERRAVTKALRTVSPSKFLSKKVT
tara:strand:+ start:495 stop:1031 length:537 start_codon:yes stop_codon:yes gene_type:complete